MNVIEEHNINYFSM